MKRSLRSWLWRVPLDQEVDEELALHVELRTRELVEHGLDPKTARDIVLSRIGDLGQLKRTCVDLGRKRDREMRFTQWLDERKADVKFTLRQLKGSPAFTAVAVVTLALGIGANSAIFALADATLIRPLPYLQPDRLVMIWSRNPTVPRAGISPLDLRDLAQQSQSFEALAAVSFGAGGGPLLEGPDGSLQSADRQSVTARFFDVLGVRPIAGRTFRDDDEGPALDPAAGPEADPHEIAVAVQTRDRFAAALAALPLVQREAFLLHAEGGLTVPEIAAATATNEEAAKSRLRYAMKKLREAIEDE